MEVALIGGAPTSRHRIDQLDKGVQRWSLGTCYRFFSPYHLWFECHKYRVWEGRWEHPEVRQHFAWLRSCPVPVMMREQDDTIPSRVQYPEDEVVAYLGRNYRAIGDEAARWEHISGGPNWMLAYAIWLNAGWRQDQSKRIRRLYVIGIDMNAMEEYFFQRSSFEHLLGIAMGEGIEVWIPPECPLLKGGLYGSQTTAEMQSEPPFEMWNLNTGEHMGKKPGLKVVSPNGHDAEEVIHLGTQTMTRLNVLRNELNGAMSVAQEVQQALQAKVNFIQAALQRDLAAVAAAKDVTLGDDWELDWEHSALRKKQPPAPEPVPAEPQG